MQRARHGPAGASREREQQEWSGQEGGQDGLPVDGEVAYNGRGSQGREKGRKTLRAVMYAVVYHSERKRNGIRYERLEGLYRRFRPGCLMDRAAGFGLEERNRR